MGLLVIGWGWALSHGNKWPNVGKTWANLEKVPKCVPLMGLREMGYVLKFKQ